MFKMHHPSSVDEASFGAVDTNFYLSLTVYSEIATVSMWKKTKKISIFIFHQCLL